MLDIIFLMVYNAKYQGTKEEKGGCDDERKLQKVRCRAC